MNLLQSEKRQTGGYIGIASIFIVYSIIGLTTPTFGYSTYPDNHRLAALPEDSLTLEQCIEIALENSHKIAIAKGNVTKAEINLKDAESGFLPQLYLSGGYNLNDTYDRFEWNENHYNLSISASITPFTSGRTLVNVAKSETALSSARQDYLLTEVGLILDVIGKYYNLLKSSELLELKKESIVQKRKDLEFAKAQFELGLVPKADILKAEVDVANAEVDSLQAEGDLKLAHAELNDVMGISLDYPTKIKPGEFIREEPPNFEDCLNEALDNRPELVQQKASLSIKKYNLRLAQIDRLPTFTITGSYNAYADKFAFAGLPVNRTNWNENTDWRVGIGLNFPISDGGVKGRAIQAAKIDLNKAELDYVDWEKEIDLEVKLAHLNLVTAFNKIDLTEKQVESAEESYNAALGRYKTGVAPITEVIDAGVALSNSKVNHIKAMYDYLLAKAILKKAMGQLPY
jgi:outer membrane protein TolC